jgi:hypothetical protein
MDRPADVAGSLVRPGEAQEPLRLGWAESLGRLDGAQRGSMKAGRVQAFGEDVGESEGNDGGGGGEAGQCKSP